MRALPPLGFEPGLEGGLPSAFSFCKSRCSAICVDPETCRLENEPNVEPPVAGLPYPCCGSWWGMGCGSKLSKLCPEGEASPWCCGRGSGGGIMRSACMDAGSAGDKGRGSTREDLVWVGERGCKEAECEPLLLDCVVEGDREGLPMLPRRFPSWGSLGIPGGLRMSDASRSQCWSVLLLEELLPGDGGICIHRWRPRTTSPCSPKQLFVRGKALAFVAASYLNDKDVLGESGEALSPPGGLGTHRGSSVPTSGSRARERGLQSSLCPAPPRCWISKQIPSLLGRWALVWCFSGACSGSGAAEEPEHPFTPFLIPLSWELSRIAQWQHPGQGTAPPRHSGWSGSGFGTISPLQQNPSVELSCSFYSEKLPDGQCSVSANGEIKN